MSIALHWILVVIGLAVTALGLVLAAAVLVLGERRTLAWLQDRHGPNRAGPFGVAQPIADAIKLITKENFVPPFADRALYTLAPMLVAMTALLSFMMVPVGPGLSWAGDMNIAILFVLAMSSISAYGILLGGWASNSKYSLLGGIRAIAQLISYELSMGLAVVGVVMLSGSFSTSAIVEAQHIPYLILQPLGFAIFLICGLAETNRIPFDLPEAENELVAGYNTEYGGVGFALFFLGEYMGILLIAALTTTLFLGGWHGPFLPGVVWFFIKTVIIVFLFFWARATLPRLRYDQLMTLGWLVLLPLALLNVLATALVGMLWM